MKRFIILITAITGLLAHNHLNAQEKDQQLDLSVDPLAFFLNGISLHGGYGQGPWHFDLEAFSLDVPASIHGNEGLTAGQQGLELKTDYYFQQSIEGPFVSAGGGVSELTVINDETDHSKGQLEYSLGFRAGYRWNTGLGKLYLTPLTGLEYTFNNQDVTVDGNTFENGPLQPYATVNIGWYFPLK